MLDIGTLCRDSKGNLGAIYKFFNATKKEEVIPTHVVYGPMENLIAQRQKWTGEEKDFPWEEVTEPMPLDNGKVHLSAIRGDMPYNTIDGFDSRPASWSKFNLPTKR